jgi:NADPH:quinone reductase-like Zn-dependent oxidoreductase/acyl carrier protein
MMLPAAAADLAHSLAEIAETARETASRAAQLWLIIRGSAETDPAAAALIGLGRVIANEFPQSAARRIALDPGLRPQAMLDALLEEVSRSDGEPEIAWTERGRFVPRLTRGPTPSAAAAPPGVRLALSEPGFLDSLRWREMLPMAPGPGEVAIEIHAAGLNFRDVMWAMGLLPDEALIDGFAGPTLGMECAGIVTAIGEGVDHVAPGDRVMAFAPACFASHTVTRAHCVAPMAPGTAFAAAATVPVAFLTVIYALGRLARLAAGETVLIHGGAGAVGLAAIQYARHRGATVIATAGSEIKRTVLASIGVEHVLDSRSLGFVDEVMALTGNQGVDVVLNSLGGEAMERSLGLLKPFGRFCELGKRDFYLNTRIGLRAVRHNISYFAIDADELVVRHPGVTGEIFDELRRLFETGALCPLPYVAYPFAEIVDAFRLMRASGHLGKVVLLPGSALGPIERPPHSFEARGDRSYLVTGGLSGFGLATAEWLVRSGARHLALIGRRGSATPGAADAVALLEAQGALTVEVLACDVADVGALESSLCQVRATMPPIGGIVHAAMVVEDGLVATLDRGGFERVLRPKIDGAEALDRLTRHDPVELFLLYSSATTSLGAPGQASYVAANCALEALARRRQKAGLPALAVAWGPIADAGYLAERPEARDALARRLGAVPMAAATALAQLPALLASGMAVANLAEVNWGVGKSFLPILAEPMFGRLVAGAVTQGGGDLAATLAGKSPEAAKEIVLGLLLDEVSAILRVARSKLDPARPLSDIGMDSLMAVELKIALERRLGVEIPALLLNDSVTLASMAARIAQGFGAAPREDATVYMRHETSSEDEADRLSEQLRADSLEAVGGSE